MSPWPLDMCYICHKRSVKSRHSHLPCDFYPYDELGHRQFEPDPLWLLRSLLRR
jgi:hypothetical protein